VEVVPVKGLRVLPLLLLAALAAPAPAGAAPPPTTGLSALEVVRAGHHPGFDRVVFELAGPVPAYEVGYVDTLVGDPSGLPVPVPGRAVLQVTLRGAEAHDVLGPRASRRTAFALPNVASAIQSGDFEGVVTYGIGLAARQPFSHFTLTGPSRVVVDVRTDVPTVFRRVYLVDQRRVEANTPPFVTPVLRRVLPRTPATGVMDRLFAGPTPLEAEEGLLPPRFPSLTARSGATGFAGLSIVDGIARVRLTGGCSSGGSTVTVADEILPTLRQFDTVDFVKIYDPAGRTQRPSGRTDSVPECLEP
jgi:hypothetical protein